MARKSQQPVPVQAALRGAYVAVSVGAFFLAVCLSSAATSKSAAMVLAALALSAAFLFWGRLRDRLKGPVLALTLVVLMDGLSCAYAVSGKFALHEFLKVFTAFCLALLLLAFTGEERPGRKVCVVLEGFAAVAGLTSIDLLSTRWVSGVVLGVLGWFTPDYLALGAVEEGVRMTSIFLSPNVFAGCMGIGVLLSLGLAVSAEKPGARAAHVACLSVNALSFVLAFSMGACVMLVPAFLVLLALTGKEERTGLLLLMVEGLVVTALSAFPISLTSMTAWTGFRPIPLLCAVGGGLVLCGLDLLGGRRLAAKLAGHGRAVLMLVLALLAGAAVFLGAALSLTTGVGLRAGESLRRSAYPGPGTYTVEAAAEGDPQVAIESQNRADTMMHTGTELYRGPLSQAAFTVPEDSLVVWFTFTAQTEGRIDWVEYTGEGGSGKVPLQYRLLPGFIANRLQGLRANQNAIQRFVFFEDGLKLFARSPVIGSGMGAFENGVRGVQSFRYDTKYAHNHYIQTLAETGLVGLALFLGLFALSGVCLWRRRKEPLAPALGAALVFMACHALVEFTFSIYCYLPMAFGVFVAISFCCGDGLPLPAWMEKRAVKNGVLLGMCVLLVLFAALLGCNIAAQNLAARDPSLENLERAAALDPFEKADHMLSYVVQVTGSGAEGEVRQKADGYAGRLGRIDSNIIPYYLAAYYLDEGQVEQGLEQAERYVRYVSADEEVWRDTFRLLEEYEQDTAEYRAGVCRIAELLEEWNEENMGEILLDEQAQMLIARMR